MSSYSMHLLAKQSLILLFPILLLKASEADIVIQATAGNTVSLSCSTEPGTTVSWKFRPRWNSTEEQYIVISGNVVERYRGRLDVVEDVTNPGYFALSITNVNVLDSGNYDCIDKDGLGKRSSVQLTVKSEIADDKPTTRANPTFAVAPESMISTTIGMGVAVIVLALLLVTGVLIAVIVCQRRSHDRHKAAATDVAAAAVNEQKPLRRRRHGSIAQSVDDLSPVAITCRASPATPGSRATVAASLLEQESRLWVNGLTVSDGYIIALRDRELQFYETTKYILQRTMTMPKVYKHYRNDMVLRQTDDEHHLYISDYFNRHIYRLPMPIHGDVEHAEAAWTVEFRPAALSVTLRQNILVTCSEARKLIEFTPDGSEILAKINLISEVEWPLHAVEIRTGTASERIFVVCHSGDVVKIVGERGEIVLSYYGSESDQSCSAYLASPCHIAVDEEAACIYVADEFNDRVLSLSFELQFQREFILREIHRPRRLFLHEKRLYIGQWNGQLKYVDT